MAEDSRAQRAEGRERRRSLASKPFEELSEAAEREGHSPLAGAKGVVGKAAAAALVGALAGAAKAYADRRSRDKDDEDEPDEQPEETREEQTTEERQHVTDEAEPQGEADEPEAETEAKPEAEAEPTDERGSHEEETNGAHGASSGDAGRIVKQAREHLQDLLGIEAESVSGLNRSNGSWHITVEAVEVRRVPESQDVLASYEVVLDDDGGVVSVERTHRYRRAQVEAD